MPDSSISNCTLRERLNRSITAGPPASSMLATWPSMTGPLLPGTIRRSSAPMSSRALSDRRTTMGIWRCARLSLGNDASKSPTVAMRMVSPIAALVTPRSAMRAKSGRTVNSGLTSDALDATEPRPGIVRSSFSSAAAAVPRASGSSPVSASTYFSPEPPRPTLLRTPGSSSNALRMLFSMPCLRGRSPRGVSKTVSVALRDSATPPGANGSPPAAPPPMVV